MRSELQRMLAQIDAEAEAAQRGLNGTAQMGGHDFVLARQREIAETYAGQLRNLYESLHPEECEEEAS